MTTLPWLDTRQLWFPEPASALDDPDGLLALGGDLSPERLLKAYSMGIFPWYSQDQPILWWSPDPRCIIFPDRLHISRSLRRTLNSRRFTVSIDTSFDAVVEACAVERSEGTWITDEMQQAYARLHRLGHAHAFEAWNTKGELVGGLYGVALGCCFFGESMFARETDASKVVFVHCVRQLESWGYAFMDCQVENDHLMSLGAELIERTTFLTLLKNNFGRQCNDQSWHLQWGW